MRRLAGRAALLCASYVALILVVIAAGFIAKVVGIWAAVLWGILVVAALAWFLGRRRERAGRASDQPPAAPSKES